MGMCPGTALISKTNLGQAEVLEAVKELAAMQLVELPSLGKAGADKSLFLLRVTAAGKRALQAAPTSPFWRRREPETGKLGRDPNILLHQTITMEQVLLALRAGVEQSAATESQKEHLRELLARAQDCAQRSTEAGSGPSLAQWARGNPEQLAGLLESLGS